MLGGHPSNARKDVDRAFCGPKQEKFIKNGWTSWPKAMTFDPLVEAFETVCRSTYSGQKRSQNPDVTTFASR